MAMEQLATGVATGIATNKTIQQLDELQKDPNELSTHILLTQIRDALVPTEKQNLDLPMALQPYPSEYIIDEQWFLRAHVCIFFGVSTPIRFDIEGIGTYLKTVGPGWVQCDVRGRLSTTDSQSHNVIVSYRVTPVGAFL
jgi:hypothetical protein